MSKKNKNPNILYVFADQLSLLALEKYGNKKEPKTPNIDFLVEQGVSFLNSYCTTPQCSPSRSSMLSGLYPHKTGVIGNVGTRGTEIFDEDLTLASYLKESGYQTAYIGKWHLGNGKASVKKHGYEFVPEISADGTDVHKSYHALRYIDKVADTEQPWFLTLSYNQPHDIYLVKNNLLNNRLDFDLEDIKLPKNYGDDLSSKPQVQAEFRDKDQGEDLKKFDKDNWKYYIAYYNYLIEFLDHQLGKLIDKLKETRQYENTLIIFTSDHGDMMGSHCTPFKGPMMYNELIKVPLIFSWPEIIPENEIRKQNTNNIDLFPTVCDLIGKKIPENLDGESLKNCIFKNDEAERNFVIVEYYSKQKWINPIRTIIKDNFKYNLYLSGEKELYDLEKDATEVNNLANKEEYNEIKSEFKQGLLNWIEDNKDPFFNFNNTDRNGNYI